MFQSQSVFDGATEGEEGQMQGMAPNWCAARGLNKLTNALFFRRVNLSITIRRREILTQDHAREVRKSVGLFIRMSRSGMR